MTNTLNRIVAGIAAIALVTVAYLTVVRASNQDEQAWARMAPPAEDALTQAVDLNRIAGFRYVDDYLLEVTDESGKTYNMKFTAACPGLRSASDFSLVTESYRSLDKFTGVGLQGRICTFKDFAPK